MPGPDDNLGKNAEVRIKQWLDHPEYGYSFDRIKDQMSGFYGSSNICDFVVFKSPNQYYIESKATWQDRFDFANLTTIQKNGLYKKSKIDNVYGLIIILFATYQRTFILNIEDVVDSLSNNIKSINIKKIDKWKIPYVEIKTLPSRKQLLEYSGDLVEYVSLLESRR